MLSFFEAIESGAIGLGLSVAGTYLYSRRKGAESLDTAWHDENDKLKEAARIEAGRRLVKVSVSLKVAPGTKSQRQMTWKQGNGTITTLVAMPEVTLSILNEGETTIRIVGCKILRVSPDEGIPETISHQEMVASGNTIGVIITEALLKAISEPAPSGPWNLDKLVGAYKLRLCLSYREGSETRDTPSEDAYVKIAKAYPSALNIVTSYEPLA